MRTLKVLLWVTAVCYLVAFPFIFVPWSVVAGIASFFGVEPVQGAPWVIYIFRVSFCVFGLVGVFFVLLALNPFKYGPMLNLGAYGLMLLGIIALITGVSIGLHPMVYLGDGISGLVLGGAILFFAGKARRQSAV